MQRALCAIALCAGLQASSIAAAPPHPRDAAPQAGVMHVALGALPGDRPPGAPRTESTAVLPTGLHGATTSASPPAASEAEPQRPTTAAMLLAALALMAGIALRRWGTGER